MTGPASQLAETVARRNLPEIAAHTEAWLPVYAAALREWLAAGRQTRLPVIGRSMRPTIEHGARVVATKCEVAAVRIGDILVYEDGAHVVCHRVLASARATTGRCFLMAGDAVRLPPSWIVDAAVIGRVTIVETTGGARNLLGARGRVFALVAVLRAWAHVITPWLRRRRARLAPSSR